MALEWKMLLYLMITLNISWPFMAVWYSLGSFGIFFQYWYVWTKKNLATVPGSASDSEKGR
jgi:hypothetical protein